MAIELRHREPIGRAPARKAVPRGASRPVAKAPLSSRLPKPSWARVKRVLWPFLLLGLGLGTYQLAQQLLPYADRPIARIGIQGELSYVSQQAIQQRIEPYAAASFFSVDLQAMRLELESMPWIARAEVRRVWPDQVTIHLVEQLPIARWGEEALLNNQGRAFAPTEAANYQHLPQLFGPKRAQEKVMRQYQMLSQMLRPLGFSIARLELRERGSWFLSTNPDSSGQSIELLLGRDHVMEKMRRFIALYDKALKEQITNIERIDLRYAHGLAVAWREPVATATAATAVRQN
jgi:cell division protein FtsQ